MILLPNAEEATPPRKLARDFYFRLELHTAYNSVFPPGQEKQAALLWSLGLPPSRLFPVFRILEATSSRVRSTDNNSSHAPTVPISQHFRQTAVSTKIHGMQGNTKSNRPAYIQRGIPIARLFELDSFNEVT